MVIRKFKNEDQPKVKVFVLNVLQEYRFCYRPEWDFDLDDPDLHYKKKGGVFLVCEDKGNIVGTVAIKNHGEGKAELKRLYLEEDYRGKKIGQKLFNLVEEYCLKNNYKKIILDTWIGMKAAQKLYEKNGFKITEKKGEQIFMEKLLKND